MREERQQIYDSQLVLLREKRDRKPQMEHVVEQAMGKGQKNERFKQAIARVKNRQSLADTILAKRSDVSARHFLHIIRFLKFA